MWCNGAGSSRPLFGPRVSATVISVLPAGQLALGLSPMSLVNLPISPVFGVPPPPF